MKVTIELDDRTYRELLRLALRNRETVGDAVKRAVMASARPKIKVTTNTNRKRSK